MTDHAAFRHRHPSRRLCAPRHFPARAPSGDGNLANGVIERVLAGLLVAGTVALAARRAHALSFGGAAAAVVVGSFAVAAGWAWGALLIAYFVASIALSRLRGAEKAQRT